MTIRRMRIECWITKTTDTHTHSEYVTHCFSHRNNGCKDAPHFYVKGTLTVGLYVL